MPARLHRPPVRGWRPPVGAIYVGPGSRWANPWRWRTRDALARVPALDGSDWELETRISSAGRWHHYLRDGRVTPHWIRYMTRAECVDLYRQALVAPAGEVRLWQNGDPHLTLADARADLAGHDLVCRCAIGQLCHADVLLELANQPEETTR
ncbi:DUF4326 domain-containing protein [Kitasatospora sp. NPDC004745]|uniref:DUF4326 domain-containing protein n=1 Tax=Kitasatospora sp. NPDC004745 TaxID=3364019 RepID=UPI0036AF6A18